MTAKILQVLIIIILGILITIGGFRAWQTISMDDNIPLYWKIIFGSGLMIFLSGFVYVLYDRLNSRKSETFRREKW